MFVNQKKYGTLNNMVVEFLEGQQNIFYFSKINSFTTTGAESYQKPWLKSTEYYQE